MWVDTLSNQRIEISADMVVLSMAVVGHEGNRELGKKLNIITDTHSFVAEAHPKLGPVETLTAGIYLCGCAQAPKDIPDTIAQASGAASKILSLFSRKELLHEPQISCVDQEVCSGCGYCESICAYQAVEVDALLLSGLRGTALPVGTRRYQRRATRAGHPRRLAATRRE